LTKPPSSTTGALPATSALEPPSAIREGSALAPAIIDRLRVQVIKDGKITAGSIPAMPLRTMLRSEAFLQRFRPVDEVVKAPRYLADFELTGPGYNDGSPGQRVFYIGAAAEASRRPLAVRSRSDRRADFKARERGL
jgi:hypothetical protein